MFTVRKSLVTAPRDEPGISACAHRGGIIYFSKQVESVGPAYICKVCLDKRHCEGIRIGGATLPDVVKVRERVRNTSETGQHGKASDSHAMDRHQASSQSCKGKQCTIIIVIES